MIGLSTCNEWQRRINLIQTSKGFHIGINVGDLQVLSLRPFSRTHMGVIGNNINTAARLMSAANSNELVISNSFYNFLTARSQRIFTEMESVEAKNIGTLRAWKHSFALTPNK